MDSEISSRQFKRNIVFYRIAAGFVIVLSLLSAIQKQIVSDGLVKGDSHIFVKSAQLLLDGKHLYRESDFTGVGNQYIYPPLFAVLNIPLTLLPIDLVITLWCIVQAFIIGWSVTTLYEVMSGKKFFALPPKLQWTLAFFTLLATSRFVLYELTASNANTFVLGLTTLALKIIHKPRTNSSAQSDVIGGSVMGMAISLKLLTLPIGFWYLLKGNPKLLVGLCIGAVLWLTAPALVIGFERNFDYVKYWLEVVILGHAPTSETFETMAFPRNIDNVSLQAQLVRFFTPVVAFEYDGINYQVTLATLPREALLIVKIFALALFVVAPLVVYAFRYRVTWQRPTDMQNNSDFIWEWGGLSIACFSVILFLPQAHQYHAVITIPAFLCIAYVWAEWGVSDKWFRGFAVLAAALTAFTNPTFLGGLLSNLCTAYGCFSWSMMFGMLAVFRLAEILRRAPQRADSSASMA